MLLQQTKIRGKWKTGTWNPSATLAGPYKNWKTGTLTETYKNCKIDILAEPFKNQTRDPSGTLEKLEN